MERYQNLLKDTGILPVICPKSQLELDTIVQALLQTPVRCIEITMRHPFSNVAISYLKRNHPELVVGAGTVNSLQKLELAIDCGADFCVSPGFDEKIVETALNKGLAYLPGCATPSEIMKATQYDINIIKYFPAECAGGVNALKLYEGAFSDVLFLPTGGITTDNFSSYLQCKNVLACGGSFMTPKALLEKHDADGIAAVITNCLLIMKEVQS